MLSPSFIEARYAQLLAMRAEIKRPAKERIALERYADPVDQATADREREFSEGMASRDSARLREIDAALERIADGTYGTCPRCDEEISARRLECAPAAMYCRECATVLEQEEKDGTKR